MHAVNNWRRMCESKEVFEHLGSSRCKVHTVGLCWGAPEILGRQLLPFRVEDSITASLVSASSLTKRGLHFTHQFMKLRLQMTVQKGTSYSSQ